MRKFRGSWRALALGLLDDSQVSSGVLYSDVLYYPSQCEKFFNNIPLEGAKRFNNRLTVEDAISCSKLKPFIVTDLVDSWVAGQKWTDREYLKQRCGAHTKLACNGAYMTLDEFFTYSDNICLANEDIPFFVFDNRILQDKSYSLSEDFCHEERIFGADVFDLLQPPYRPDNKWLLVAPKGSFSQWHIDPNSTSAWNAVISGHKLWLLLPPSCVPCGVFPSADESAVKQPRSLMEWFGSGAYAETKKLYKDKLVEVVCGPKEVIFVPRGWWHAVVNLDSTVAVTQNFASEGNVHHIRRYLQEKKQCVSGIPHEYRRDLGFQFDKALKEKRPELLSESAEIGGGAFSFWNHLKSVPKPLSVIKKKKLS
jgi:oxalate decarboxylase/phosphoglucose isomerase-like protein (cupin superfamily)